MARAKKNRLYGFCQVWLLDNVQDDKKRGKESKCGGKRRHEAKNYGR